MTREHPLTGEGGAGDDEGSLWNDPFQSAGQQQPEVSGKASLEHLERVRLLLAVTWRSLWPPSGRRGCAGCSARTASAARWHTEFWLSVSPQGHLQETRPIFNLNGDDLTEHWRGSYQVCKEDFPGWLTGSLWCCPPGNWMVRSCPKSNKTIEAISSFIQTYKKEFFLL